MKKLIALTGCLLISACSPPAQDPKDIAQQYWQAMQLGDYEKARSLVSTSSQSSFDEYMHRPENSKPILHTVALIESRTNVSTVINTGNSTTQFDTVLVMQNGNWLIDASASEIPAPRSSLEQGLNDMAEQLSSAVDGSIEQMEETLDHGKNMLEDILRDGSQQLGESASHALQNLNQAIEDAMRQLEERRQPPASSQPAMPDEGPI